MCVCVCVCVCVCECVSMYALQEHTLTSQKLSLETYQKQIVAAEHHCSVLHEKASKATEDLQMLSRNGKYMYIQHYNIVQFT